MADSRKSGVPSGAEKRGAQRFTHCVQIAISGEDATGTSFSEQAVTIDVSKDGCRFELLRPLRPNDLIKIRLTDNQVLVSEQDRYHIFKVAWVEPSRHGWTIGATILENGNPWSMIFSD